jgi:outer membrane protein OmpA-like peptidoglycan-associated protein
MVVSETLDKYAISYTRQLKGTTTSTDQSVISIAIGSLTTGTVTARSVFLSSVYPSSGVTTANYAAYSTNELGRDQCVAEFGATKNSAPLTYANTSISSLQFRPDGSLFFGFLCRYSTMESIQLSNQPGALKDYSASLLVGLKISGSSLVVDTTFGSNGRVVTFNSDTACLMMGPGSVTVDTSVTSLTSTSPYFVIINNEYARSTTLPSWNTGGLYTSYDGCSSMGMSTSFTNKLTPYTANGTALTTQTINTGNNSYVSRWVIDPLGRWNGLLRSMGMTPSTSAIRLVNGILDATLGTNGLKSLSTLPSTITVGGATVRMSYSISGVVSSGNDLYFTGVAQTSTGTSMDVCASTATITQSYYPYLLSFDSGLLATYGTNGLGVAGSISAIENASCKGSVAGTSYVDATGRIGYLTSVAAIGSQTAGYAGMKWDAAQGVTSGSDGEVGVTQVTTTTVAPTTTTTTVAPTTTTTTIAPVAAAARVVPNRIDKVVYSKKLPTAVQTNTALKVLSTKDAKTLDIRTVTPRVCVGLTTSVLLVNRGRCSVQIIDQNTKAVVRSLSTTVTASKARVGSVPTVASPVMFKQASAVLNATGLAQVQTIAKAAKNASRVVVIGHAAALTDISEFRFAISRDRAKAVKNALVKAGVTATIEFVSQSDNQPVKTKKTEADQSKNRRADVYIFR